MAKPKLKRDLSTPENREFWAFVDAAAEEVAKWPDSMRASTVFLGYNDNDEEE